jgi:hypothetical protein
MMVRLSDFRVMNYILKLSCTGETAIDLMHCFQKSCTNYALWLKVCSIFGECGANKRVIYSFLSYSG